LKIKEYFVDWIEIDKPIIRSFEYAPRDLQGPIIDPKSFRACKDEITEQGYRDIERGKEIIARGKRLIAETRAIRKADVT
jgi:hypothetical protein